MNKEFKAIETRKSIPSEQTLIINLDHNIVTKCTP